MERRVLMVCSVVGLLGILSAVTGFVAEATRIKGSQVQFVSTSECAYPRSPAMGLGLTAAISLLIAQLIINVSSGCICCKRSPNPSNPNWKIALVSFVISWFSFVIAFLLLLTGAALNDQHGGGTMYFGNYYYYCYVVKPGVFAGGAVLSFASVLLAIVYYLTLNLAKNNSPLWGNPVPAQGIALGQPQFLPQNTQQPVFVHEDVYARRQYA
ncbi:uncharacterized protein LOC111490852 [Cucurbita maxima]|uniref:Uncharacterized protein LOC111490852 n=1 Tax=Cucurbita maxima TaxID=3661 RepID=A0A6J1K7C7_CUCMA|nr:uncharacterized protein LOC111490852 [Cucurbita maxima]